MVYCIQQHNPLGGILFMNHTIRRLSLAAILCLSLDTATGFAAPKEAIPNPIVNYATVQEAVKAAGFTPLYLPKISGYHVREVMVISKDLIDLLYTRDGDTGTVLRIRTAKAGKNHPSGDISGIYGAQWTMQQLKGITVYTGTYTDPDNPLATGHAAHWQIHDTLFSFSADTLSAPEFQHLLEDGLVDLAVQYF